MRSATARAQSHSAMSDTTISKPTSASSSVPRPEGRGTPICSVQCCNPSPTSLKDAVASDSPLPHAPAGANACSVIGVGSVPSMITVLFELSTTRNATPSPSDSAILARRPCRLTSKCRIATFLPFTWIGVDVGMTQRIESIE